MIDYVEYTILLIIIPSTILARLSIYDLNIDRFSITGIFSHFAFFTFYSVIIAAFVYFIRHFHLPILG